MIVYCNCPIWIYYYFKNSKSALIFKLFFKVFSQSLNTDRLSGDNFLNTIRERNFTITRLKTVFSTFRPTTNAIFRTIYNNYISVDKKKN